MVATKLTDTALSAARAALAAGQTQEAVARRYGVTQGTLSARIRAAEAAELERGHRPSPRRTARQPARRAKPQRPAPPKPGKDWTGPETAAPWAGKRGTPPPEPGHDPATIVETRLGEARALLAEARDNGDLRGWASVAKVEAELAVQLQQLRPPAVDPENDPANLEALEELRRRFECAVVAEETKRGR